MRSRAVLALWALLATMPAARAAGVEEPVRVVSMNLCADELVLRLADRAQVLAVTYLASDPRGSTVASAAAGVPVTRGLTEEVVALRPGLVIAGAFTTRTTVGMLRRVGAPVLELGVPADLDGVRAQIRQVAEALGHPERGEALVADLDAKLASVTPSTRPLRALVMRPNAFTVAPGGLGDALIRAAGLVNVAAEIGRDRFGQVPLEAAALADADLIVTDEGTPGMPSLADTLLHHPVFRALADQGRTVAIPNRFWTCPGPQVAEVVARLAAAANARAPRP
ncbi:ABC transporter substrate-binding protein [Methylorubrum salsuginis]|uniref:Iron complex transport system substrate-binding protein n=1 Tax=Methylorubrum salsuginis TaxID=414703 RepID=A0A1I4LF54_9HYPH|nr:ABC transporter substrate-binding protein [Methylorubrum salsuginis]SFL89560.1 iron complex transport system substrate-binding protein [Methylorubrum salsuginis]